MQVISSAYTFIALIIATLRTKMVPPLLFKLKLVTSLECEATVDNICNNTACEDAL